MGWTPRSAGDWQADLRYEATLFVEAQVAEQPEDRRGHPGAGKLVRTVVMSVGATQRSSSRLILFRCSIQDHLQRCRAVQSRRRNVGTAGDSLALSFFPAAAVKESRRFERRAVDIVEGSCIHDALIRLGTRHVEHVHAAMRAERMLRH